MVYSLEKKICRNPGNVLQTIWKQYAFCGKRVLLEQVRMGQPHPEHWRVILVNACDVKLAESTFMKKAV